MGFTLSIKLSPELRRLLAAQGIPDEVAGEVSSNLEYMLALEYGWSGQAPRGMVRRQLRHLRAILRGELERAFRVYGHDPAKAAEAGVSIAIAEIARAVSDATPVDSGRARNDWELRLPDGSTLTLGPEVTAEAQAAHRRTPASRAKRNAAAKARRAAKATKKARRRRPKKPGR